jgi:uncharacterized tellurite resistance protein B-like protein
MHVVLGLLTSIVTILYLLDRMGIDLGGLNPFYWRRRRAWAAKYQGDPIFSVEDPMHVAAILIIGAVKLDGDVSAEQKNVILEQFESSFSLSAREASELLGSAAHLLGAPQVMDAQLKGVADKNKDQLSGEQAESMIKMMVDVASADGDLSAKQEDYIANIRSQFIPVEKGQGTWS